MQWKPTHRINFIVKIPLLLNAGEAHLRHGLEGITWKATYLEEIQHLLCDGIWSVEDDVVDVLKIEDKRCKHKRD